MVIRGTSSPYLSKFKAWTHENKPLINKDDETHSWLKLCEEFMPVLNIEVILTTTQKVCDK